MGDDLNGSSTALESPRSPLLTFVVFFSALTGFMLGFDLSIIAIVLSPIADQFSLCKAKEFTCFKKDLFVAMIGPGALVGSLSGGFVADVCGRRLTLIISDVFFIVGSLMFYFANTFTMLLVARAFVGVGVGIGFVVFSTYISEIAPASHRGRLVLCQEVAQCTGVLVTYLLGATLGDTRWRFLLASGALIASCQLVGMPFLPESPRWLFLQGDIFKARETMRKLGMDDSEVQFNELCCLNSEAEPIKSNEALSTSSTAAECTSHQEGPLRNPSSSSRIKKLWACRRRLLVACIVGIAQNVLCTNAALYFSTDLMLLAGICKPYQWGIGLGVMKLIGVIVTYNLVDRVGRRVLLLTGTLGLCIDFILLAPSSFLGRALLQSSCDQCRLLQGSYSLVPGTDITTAGMFCFTPEGANLPPSGLAGPYSALVLVGLFLLLFFWEISWAGLMYVVASEILPSDVRGIGMGFVVAGFWISLFLSQLSFEFSFKILQISGTFVGLAFAAILIAAFTFMSVPDMTGQSLEKINRMLSIDDRASTEGDVTPNSSGDRSKSSEAQIE